MSREIKFRLRIKHRRGDHPDMTMIVPLMGEQNGLIETPFNNGDWEVVSAEQYTGLNDKNGREIYEGDIVKKPVEINHDVHGEWELKEVWMANGTTFFGFLQSEKQKKFPRKYMVGTIEGEVEDIKSFIFAENYTLYEMEIIGNIHENPELLETP